MQCLTGVVVMLGVMALGCGQGADSWACKKAERACRADYEACDDLWLRCGSSVSEDTALVSRALLAGCEGEKSAASCRGLMQHVRKSGWHMDAERRAKALAAACAVKPKFVCEVVRDPELDNMGIRGHMKKAEEALACDADPVRHCVRETSVAVLNQSMADAKEYGDRTYALLEAACIAHGGKACVAAYVKVKARFDTDPVPVKAFPFLKRACNADRERYCGLLADGCHRSHHGCDRDGVKTLLEAHCHSPTCMGAAARLFPELYIVRACTAGHMETCTGGGFSAHRDGDVWAKRFADHCQIKRDAACHRRAGVAFSSHRVWKHAVPFFVKACELGDKESCDILPYMQVELRPPANRDGLRALRSRCQSDDAAACLRLAEVYKVGLGVPANPPNSALYAKKACKLAKAKHPSPKWKAEACAWRARPKPGRPLNDPISGLMRALTAPFALIPP